MTATSEPGHADDWADTGPIPLAPATETGAGAGNVSQPTGDADKAREARYAEAIYLASDPCGCNEPTPWADLSPARQGWFVSVVAPPVLAVADAEVEAATRELRAEVERLRKRGASLEADLKQANLWSWEAERDQLRAAMTALADEWEADKHRVLDDEQDPRRQGWRTAVVDHAARLRAALAQVGAADTQPEGASEERWCTCGHAQTAHLHSAGPCTRPHEDWSGAQCDCRRFGEMALTRYAREVAEELAAATPTSGSKVDTAPETACGCGSPDAYSLNPAEAIVHCTDGRPCYITAVGEDGFTDAERSRLAAPGALLRAAGVEEGNVAADAARGSRALARGCPTCTGQVRQTVGMVCPTCGTDYAGGAS